MEPPPTGGQGRLANFDRAGGVRIAGYVRKPPGDGPVPIVIVLHGGGPTAKPVSADTDAARAEKLVAEAVRAAQVMGRSTNPPLLDFLARGWAVYTIDYRPNPRYKLDPLEWDDTQVAINQARGFPFVDPKRIAIYGGSHGAHVAGRMVSREQLACAVLCAPAGIDLIALAQLAGKGTPIGGNQRLVREAEQRAGMKMSELGKNPAAHRYTSLITEAAGARCPILLISGRNDPNAPLPVMEAYADKLRAAGKVVETYHPDNGPHGFYVGLPKPIPETEESTRRAVAFIQRHFDQKRTK